MRIKTIVILVIAILLTIVFMQNLDPVRVTILFSTMYVSKVSLMLGTTIVGLLIGYLIGRPGRKKYDHTSYDNDDRDDHSPGTLSDEDKEYIN